MEPSTHKPPHPDPDSAAGDFRSLADNANDGIVVLSKEGTVLYANRSACLSTGFELSAIVGVSMFRFIAPEDLERVAAIRKARQIGAPATRRYEARLLDPDGRAVPVEVSVGPTTWRGAPADIVLLRDLSERKRAEQELDRRAAVLEAVNFATERFLQPILWEEWIGEAIERLGRAMQVTRIFLYEFRKTPGGALGASRRSRWENPAFKQDPDPAVADFPLDAADILPWIERLRRGETVQDSPRVWPAGPRVVLENQRTRSILIVPVLLEKELWGFLGLADSLVEHEWTPIDVDTLRVAANILGALLHREMMEGALRESEEKYRGVVEGSKQPIVILDREGIFRFANARSAEDFGRPQEEIVGKSMMELFPSPYAKALMQTLRAALDSGELLVTEWRFTILGEARWYEVRIQPLVGPDGRADRVIVVANDISERKEVEEQILSYQTRLRSLTSELALTEQRERRRIAGEIHDRIGQTLAISRIRLGLARESPGAPPRMTEQIDEIRGMIERIIQDTRSLTFELSPPILYEIGFEPAVEWLVERFQGQHGIHASFRDDGAGKPLGDDLRVVLFQAVQEVLVNVVKHAHARRVEVAVRKAEGHAIAVEVKDDGVGFDPALHALPGSRPQGFGFFSIRERLGHLGGSLEIDSAPGKGTRIILRAPLRETRNSGEESGT